MGDFGFDFGMVFNMAGDVRPQSSLALLRPSMFLQKLLRRCEGGMRLLERTLRRRTVLCAWRMVLTVAHDPCGHAKEAFVLWAYSVARGAGGTRFEALY